MGRRNLSLIHIWMNTEMKEAAKLLEFEYAAQIRDKIKELTDGK